MNFDNWSPDFFGKSVDHFLVEVHGDVPCPQRPGEEQCVQRTLHADPGELSGAPLIGEPVPLRMVTNLQIFHLNVAIPRRNPSWVIFAYEFVTDESVEGTTQMLRH